MVIILIAIYTLALCIGTIAGNMLSQGFFSVAILAIPFYFARALIAGAISYSYGWTYFQSYRLYEENVDRYGSVIEKMSI